MSVLLETTLGNLVIDLDFERLPIEAFNFLKLCKSGYYNYQCLYNLNKDYSVECGDAMVGYSDRENLRLHNTSIQGLCVEGPASARLVKSSQQYKKHTEAQLGDVGFLVSVEENSTPVVGSKFMFALAETSKNYEDIVCFGHVTEDCIQTLRTINEQLTDKQGRPSIDIRIKQAYLLHDPFPDPQGHRTFDIELPEKDVRLPPRLTLGVPNNESEVEEEKVQRDIRSKELTLEILGDIPHVGIKPSDKVLFICKLNPLTRAKDLAVIFSRFGTIEKVEIVRDKETGASLHYGFIEFTNKTSCEAAYSKMEGVLIDDRRIHVDFCQSTRRAI